MKTVEQAQRWIEVRIYDGIGGPLRGAVSRIAQDTRFINGWGSCVGTNHAHHAFKGGLLVHTQEVMELCDRMAAAEALAVNVDRLCVAALFHDFGKIYDYDQEGKGTRNRDLIRHTSESYNFWMEVANNVYVNAEDKLIIGHCILSHHGRLEWGAPVEPKCVEASILHFADMLSCHYGVSR